jgi:hypothetical protein
MRAVRFQQPVTPADAPLVNPLEHLSLPLAQHYGQRAERYRAAAQGYVDDKLSAAFPAGTGRKGMDAAGLLADRRKDLLASVMRWSCLEEAEVVAILDKLEERARALRLRYSARERDSKLTELTALATSLAVDFSYTGRFTV